MMGRPRRRGGVVRGVARTAVVAGTAATVAGGVRHRQDAKYADREQAAVDQQQAAYDQGVADAAAQPQAAPAPAEDDSMAKLKQLGELRDAGVLTDEEFSAAKVKILTG